MHGSPVIWAYLSISPVNLGLSIYLTCKPGLICLSVPSSSHMYPTRLPMSQESHLQPKTFLTLSEQRLLPRPQPNSNHLAMLRIQNSEFMITDTNLLLPTAAWAVRRVTKLYHTVNDCVLLARILCYVSKMLIDLASLLQYTCFVLNYHLACCTPSFVREQTV